MARIVWLGATGLPATYLCACTASVAPGGSMRPLVGLWSLLPCVRSKGAAGSLVRGAQVRSR